MRILSLLTILCIAITNAAAQQTSKLPSMSDWFLSTGDWNKDPQIYIREFGTGQDTVIMLHGGWGGDHAGLIDAVSGLSKDYHFIFYDQRGSLRSPFPDVSITYDAHIEDLERLRKELKLGKFKLVGHSMGGLLASAYAARYPDRIKSLILLAPANLKIPISEDEQAIHKNQNQKFDAFFNRPEAAKEIEKYNLQRPDAELSSRELTSKSRILFAKRMLYDITKWPNLTGGRALYKGNVYALTENTYPKEGWDLIPILEKQTFSTSIITGSHDFLDFGNGVTKKWVEGKKKITFTVIPNAGHLLWIDQPDVFTKELRKKL